MMEKRDFSEVAAAFEPVAWDSIPDLGLYMDQVVTYIGSVLSTLYGEEQKEFLTSSMVNNYVKQSLLPRPRGKKYYREHLATLLMITALKRTMAMDEIKRLFFVMGEDSRVCYETFSRCQKELMARAAVQTLDDGAEAVLEKAISSALLRLECLSILGTLYEQRLAQKEKEKKRKKDKQDD